MPNLVILLIHKPEKKRKGESDGGREGGGREGGRKEGEGGREGGRKRRRGWSIDRSIDASEWV
jgi:hypothetical protein